MNKYVPLVLSVLHHEEQIDFNLAGIKTELLLPLKRQIDREIFTRTTKVDFREERMQAGLVINPKDLTLQFSQKQLELFKKYGKSI